MKLWKTVKRNMDTGMRLLVGKRVKGWEIIYMWFYFILVLLIQNYNEERNVNNGVVMSIGFKMECDKRILLERFYYDNNGRKHLYYIVIKKIWIYRYSSSLLVSWLLKKAGDVEMNPGPENCGSCEKLINDELENSIFCNMCTNWIHDKCSGLKEDEFKIMSRGHMFFVCRSCGPNLAASNKLASIAQKIDNIGKEYSYLHMKIKEQEVKNCKNEEEIVIIRSSQEKLKEVQDEDHKSLTELIVSVNKYAERFVVVEEKLANVSTGIKSNNNLIESLSASKENTSNEVIKEKEIKDVKKELLKIKSSMEREKNVIIFNLKDLEDIKEQTNFDRETIESMLKYMEIECNYKEIKIYRLGKYGEGKTRPIKMECGSKSTKWDIIKKGKSLKDSNDTFVKKIFVTPDRTVEERYEQKLLFAELKIRKENGENVTIKNGKIVKNNDFTSNGTVANDNTT